MRKLFAILALGCLLFLTAGYHLYYYLRMAEAKKEMRAELLRSKGEGILKFLFTLTEGRSLQWEDENEFHYKGTMYDVVKKEVSQDEMVLWCVADDRETSLLNSYLKTQKQSSENSGGNAVQKLLATPFLPSSVSFAAKPCLVESTAFIRYRFTLPCVDSIVLTPPPKVC